MSIEDDRIKLRFQLANENLQSISRAQGLYLTTLLVYICVVWAMYYGATDKVGVAGIDIKIEAVWKVTPFIVMILTLAVIGTLNATMSAYAELKDAGRALFGESFEGLFCVDTNKNLIDYIALLQVVPWTKTRLPTDSHSDQSLWIRLHHLIFPGLFALVSFTSYFSIGRASLNDSPRFIVVFGWCCFGCQALFLIRPMWRWFDRLFGASSTATSYN
jgi:hypothetical protein